MKENGGFEKITQEEIRIGLRKVFREAIRTTSSIERLNAEIKRRSIKNHEELMSNYTQNGT